MKDTIKVAFPFTRTAIATALALVTSPGLTQELVLEEVIVTAQKRESTVQDIAATVNVVTGQSIDEFSALSFDDLETQTAGLTLATPNARNQSVAMRGVSINSQSGVDATVTVYYNDQLVSSTMAFGQLYDLARVEVLRGPQGAIQGRSSPAGAINIHSQSADLYEAGGYVQATLGDNDGLNGQVAYGAPLIEGKLAARVAAVYDTSNAANVENLTTGLDDPELEATSYRINTVWQVTDNLEANLTYQNFDRDVHDPYAVDGVDTLGERPSLQAEDRISLAPTNNKSSFEYDYLNLRLNWQIGDLELVSVTGWSDETSDYREENDRADYVRNPDAPTWQRAITDQEYLVQELRLSSNGNDFWDWMVGAYYQDLEIFADFKVNTTVTLPQQAPGLPPAFAGYQFTTETQTLVPLDNKQWSVFTFNSFYLTSTVELQAGLRYTDYEKSRAADTDLYSIPYLPDIEGVPPEFQDQAKDFLVGFVTEDLPITGIPEQYQDIDDDSWTGSLTLRWNWTDEISLYGNYNRGYRTKGNSIVPGDGPSFLDNPEDVILHDEETSDAIEIGMKGRFWQGRASLNAALFYQQYDGYLGFVQGVEVINDEGLPQTLPGGIIFNGDADIKGIEVEGQVMLSETWQAGGAVAYVDAQWSDAEQPCNDREPGEVMGYCDLDGEKVGGEPEWSATLNSEYYIPLEDTEVYFRGLYKYTGERDNVSASAGIGRVSDEFDAYHLLDLFVGWRSSDYRWDVNVFVKNALDEDEIILQDGPDRYDTQFSGGSYTRTNVLPERIIGLMARYNF